MRQTVPHLRVAAVVLGLWAGLLASGPSWAQSYSEEAVKAVYLHRFANYVTWPQGDLTRFTIGVMGDEPVAAELERLAPQLKIQDLPVAIRRVKVREDLQAVQILYVGPSAAAKSRAMLEVVASQPVLVVTTEPEGFQRGGVINFVRAGRNVRFEVSLSEAHERRLRIDSGLLAVAVRVIGRPQGQQFPGGWREDNSTQLASRPIARACANPSPRQPLPCSTKHGI